MSVLEYKCPNCGGGLAFGSDAQKMKCPYCDSEFELSDVEVYNASLQDDAAQDHWESYEADSGSGSWTQEELEHLNAYTCPSCGGEILADENTAATFCPYCENPAILPGRLSDSFKPDLIIPFSQNKKAAQEAFLRLCKGKRLLPKNYTSTQRLEKITGIYVPFWLYDGETAGSARYNATRTHVWADSKYNYTRTDHFLLIRGGSMTYQGVPVDGSKKMDDAYMESIEPFDYSKAEPFQSAYLSGYLADKYDVDAAQCQPRAEQRMRQTTADALRGTVHGYVTVMPQQTSLHVKSGKARYVLLPVWLLNSQYKGKTYTFAMNGQTGKMVGQLPVDMGRFWLHFAGIWGGLFAIFSLICLLLR